jgi:adenosylmethionine-8-amino-7-oxononanoate aminotransferase
LLRPLGNVLYVLPPYCTSQESLARIAGAIENTIGQIEAG